MKKIALILLTEPRHGGQHQYALMAMECLVERADKDLELLVLCGNPFWKSWCKKAGIKYLDYSFPDVSFKMRKFNYKFPRVSRFYYTYMTTIGRKIIKEKIDILFSAQQGVYVPNYKVKLLIPAHDLMHRYEPDFPEVQCDYQIREIYMKSIAKYAACVLVDSNLGKKQFIESYKNDMYKNNVVSLPFAVSEYIWDSKEEYIDVPDKYIFYPAQFWKHKNHLNLLKAINILKETIGDIHLVLVGSEKNNLKEIKKYIKEHCLEKQVTIKGYVSNENITYLYKHAVAMVMPSYFGPTNIPPLEAMVLGCPVAVSNRYAMPKQVGKAGLLFDPDSPEEIADCIKKIWTDENLRKTMIQSGYKKIEKWTKQDFGIRLNQIIDRL